MFPTRPLLERFLFLVLDSIVNRFYRRSHGVFLETYMLWSDRRELLNGVPPIRWDKAPYLWEAQSTSPAQLDDVALPPKRSATVFAGFWDSLSGIRKGTRSRK